MRQSHEAEAIVFEKILHKLKGDWRKHDKILENIISMRIRNRIIFLCDIRTNCVIYNRFRWFRNRGYSQWVDTGSRFFAEAASEDPDFDWKAVSMKKFSILDPGSGDQVRDIMGYFRRDPTGTGEPLLDSPVGSLLGLERPPLSGTIEYQRMSGSRAPWQNPPYFTGGEQPDGIIPDTARVLVADSDEYGGVNLNQAIDSPTIDLQGSAWVRVKYDSFFTANQDQSAGNWF